MRASLDRARVGLGHGGKEGAGGPKQPGKLYAFYSAKGGAGTTTTATNFAVVLHRVTGKKTLLVDLDLELGEIALLLGVQPRFNFVDMVQNFHRMDAELLASYIERHSCGVHLLSAPYHPDKAEVVTGEEIRRILQFLRKHYDYVVVDTSKSFSPATLAAIEQADLAFIVTNVDLASLRNLQRGLPLLKKMLGRGDDHIRLVVNRYHSDNDITLDDVAQTLGMPVFRTLSNDYEGVSRLDHHRQAHRAQRQLEVQPGHEGAGRAGGGARRQEGRAGRATERSLLPRWAGSSSAAARALRRRRNDRKSQRFTSSRVGRAAPRSAPLGKGGARRAGSTGSGRAAGRRAAAPAARRAACHRRGRDRQSLLPAGQGPGPPPADRAAQPVEPGAGEPGAGGRGHPQGGARPDQPGDGAAQLRRARAAGRARCWTRSSAWGRSSR